MANKIKKVRKNLLFWKKEAKNFWTIGPVRTGATVHSSKNFQVSAPSNFRTGTPANSAGSIILVLTPILSGSAGSMFSQ
jgi:hypothetical protein